MDNILGSAIKELRKSKKMTQRDLAKLTGLKQNTISNHENGKRQLDEIDIRTYARALGVSPQTLFNHARQTSDNTIYEIVDKNQKIQSIYDELNKRNKPKLITYGNDLLKEQRLEENNQSNNVVTLSDYKIKECDYEFYDTAASAGTGQYLNDVNIETITLPVDIDADFVVPIYGDSMEPDYHSGDYVFVKLSVNLSSGDIGVFELYGDAYIKQIFIEGDKAYLRSLNPKYDDIIVDADSDFRIIGEVVGSYSEK
ncbi:Phage transcriptional repressor [Streptococcus gallolyticus]|uniref:Phage transcriptional repressor n=1 Tax=Streptococcus gallolyticus TaxID=315405 RepID=A0A139MV22_9STRE|nr:S24 family peptidase [Streptococcus gallolyticus]KXT67635.1 Phage transcriptional repressor [Streptococcus gallolyticus]QBX24963.1 transcriptional repressor [Streptococcus phage Javan224]